MKWRLPLPQNYIVAATGELIKDSIHAVVNEDLPAPVTLVKKQTKPFFPAKKENTISAIPSSRTLKTVVYKQNDVIDFAWFADKNFIVKKDTMALPSGRVINVAAYSLPAADGKTYWINAVNYIKKTVLTRTNLIGEYPYNTVTAVQANAKYIGGMEYPTITLISGAKTERAMESVIEHEVGHNWLYGILATNEREHPWMDEGMNSYYKSRYPYEPIVTKITKKGGQDFWDERTPVDEKDFLLRNIVDEKKDQPIETNSEKFSAANYDAIAYYEASQWMKWMEITLGKKVLDSCMREYYRQWKFKHPYPEDLKAVFENVSRKNLEDGFSLLQLSKKGDEIFKSRTTILGPYDVKADYAFKRKTKLTSFFSFKETNKYKYIFASPAVGYNKYDKLMIGALLHNYTLPAEKFQFLVAPLYATGSRQFNGIARFDYRLHQGNNGKKLTLSLSGASFNGDAFTDSTDQKNFLRFSKIVPGLKYVFANNNPRSQLVKYIQWKTFFIRETSLLFTRDTINEVDVISYPVNNRYVNQLRFVVENNRVLYPYNVELQAEQGRNFIRLAFTGNYFFNYAKGGGMNVRLFAGKFFYLGEKTFAKQFETDTYQLNMTGPKGYEDYTYSNYFAGRNYFDGAASQQIMQRDGFFKVRTDLLSSKTGKTDNWLAAANFTSDFPKAFNPLQVLPVKIPLKVFVDVGTYAEAWQKNSNQGKFIYDAGLQLSLFKEI
ncbi:MAG: hypothetical protein IPP72_08340 [Chitinophagaceae bacterium]|nr:hypothetical protein [Chitinophagaceae bacterium]